MSSNEKVYSLLKALANENRLKILQVLTASQQPIHIEGLSRILGKDYSAVYRDVETLEKAGIVGIYIVGRSRVPYIRKKDELNKLFDLINTLL
ncbi:MAG: winged helix-turn-helix transcriptional regulator [Nitrososphaerota archaeon]|jgi:DNA-binding transcriptional ArsR family regulator|nr:winged helix-turn-helix domain-containing protein [Nitrososphaerota archaeon]MDG6927562.1 winged helix-turn-helix transcriptional regulator [Nitrososphaerota archaeon]MDG6930664.1 winged helix-turn-helix transcriptional regulator [Nitrososphaerota archaeon]MDG6932499.1 winged helix-turn-helix transcriptional regulator [Nitrososphaerota archaeon]MDG6936220.1 winged helix-turn-helix transcriptional regulator [Nitrososphaerota archaeon]